MKKSVKRNLLKSLFLIGTILTVSACDKGDKNNANIELQNEIQSLKQQKKDIEKELDQYKEKVWETEEKDKKLLESIKTEIDKLETVDNTIDFSKGLDSIKSSLCKISSGDIESKATEYFTNYLKDIKFEFVKDDQDYDLINFKCGNLCIKSINYNVDAFYKYCYFSKTVMDIVGCDDKYKIDLSQYSEKWSYELYNKLKSFPKEYFSTAKTFSFDIDDTTKKVTAGWTDKISVVGGDLIENIVSNLFFLYDINPDFVDKNFDFDKVLFNNVIYINSGNFSFNFNFKNVKLGFFEGFPISNFLRNVCFDRLDFDCDSFLIQFLKSDGKLFWSQKISNEEEFLNFLKSCNITIKNRPAIVLKNNKIGFRNHIEKKWPFHFDQYGYWKDLSHFLKILNSLKDCNFIDVEKVSLDFGYNENSLKLGEFDLLKFYFYSLQMDSYSYNVYGRYPTKDIAYFLSLLFKLFDVDYTVKLDGLDRFTLSTNEKTYSYTLDKDGFLKKVEA